MSSSDEDYIAESDDDTGAHQVSSKHGTRSSGPVKAAEGGTGRKRAAWEDIQRSWDTVVEGADGSINSAVEGLREAGKRKRFVVFFFFGACCAWVCERGYGIWNMGALKL